MVDIKTLIESAGDDTELAEDLLALFNEQAVEGISALADAAQRQDAEQAVAAAHKLVGSAVACGFVDLSQTLRRIELQCRSEMPADIEEQIKTVKELMERSGREMDRLLTDERNDEKGTYCR
ncbi:Hpt domain-containing protein [Pontiella sp.]|uniref:Hpt domain-containing protein n=1 Tax=Pontiella sp. TaxID=2837462 RepID=UPI0035646FE3